MPIDLYYTNGSPPCRFVALVADALGVPFNVKNVDLGAGGRDQPEFKKVNPLGTVPTLVDDGLVVCESRAIGRYLVNQYGGDSSLYPKDPKARALVDQRLDFDIGTLFPAMAVYFYPQIFEKAPPNEESLKKLHKGLATLDTFLVSSKYVAGETLTIADLAIVVTVSTAHAIGVSLTDHPNVAQWFELVKSTATNYEEANGKGAQMCKEYLEKIQSTK